MCAGLIYYAFAGSAGGFFTEGTIQEQKSQHEPKKVILCTVQKTSSYYL